MTVKSLKAVDVAHRLLADRLSTALVAVDATCGNGHDTLFLASRSPAEAAIWAFDIQPAALAVTADKLAAAGLAGKVRLIEACHSRLGEHIAGPIDVAILNLGYLPGGDHAATTLAATTLGALGQILERLVPGGLVAVVAYPGHPAGFAENEAVAEYLAALPPRQFAVASWQALGRLGRPPVLYIVEKAGSGEHESFTSRPD
jgi:hypothetical protein